MPPAFWTSGSRARALAVAFVALWTIQPAATREFRAADTQAENYPTVQALYVLDRELRAATGGRHGIRVFHSRQLGEEKETIEQTRVGAIDINRTNVAPLGSFVPAVNVLALPFLFRSVDHLHKVLDGPIGEEILASFESQGFIGLAFYDSGARSIYNSKRPIRSPADLQGLRIRVQQSAQMVAMFKALGAEPVELPYGQVLTGLSTGLIDGAENNWPSYVTTDHFTAAKNYSLTEHTMGPEVLVMSVRAWTELSEDDRRAFKEAARRSTDFMRGEWVAWEERARKAAEAAGNSIVGAIDKTPFAMAMGGIYDEAIKDPAMRDLVERIRKVQ